MLLCSVEWYESLSPDHIPGDRVTQRCTNRIWDFREPLRGEGEDLYRVRALPRMVRRLNKA